MHTHETTEAVLRTLLDPEADVIDSAGQLGLTLAEFLQIAESPPVLQAIEALERIAEIRKRALLARSAHTAVAALERIADGDPQTPGAVETCRKAAAQILRLAPKPETPHLAPAEGAAPLAPDHDTQGDPGAPDRPVHAPQDAESFAPRNQVAQRNGHAPAPA